MRVVANSIPKSGTHLLLRLVTQLGFELIDFGGVRPGRPPADNGSAGERALRSLLGLRKPNEFLGIGPHLAENKPLAPARSFLRTRGPEKVTVGVDIPRKIGQDWLGKRLDRVPDDTVISAHCTYTPELAGLFSDAGMRTVCILRDPRDTAVSHMHYLKKLEKHPVHQAYLALPNDHDRLMFSIRGGELGGHTLLSVRERYERFLGWEREAGAVLVKFEELVGPQGGGTAEAQRDAIERVAEHLEVNLEDDGVSRIAERLYGSGRTFRKGRAGGWMEDLSADHRQEIKKEAGDLLVGLGYEEDDNW